MTGPFDDPDLVACAGLVERGDPERFAAVMAAPVAARAVLFPILAMHVEVTRAPWVTQETMIAEMRLQWWADALDEIIAGGPVRRHEVTTPLARVATPAGARLLQRIVAARRWDIYRDPHPDGAAQDTYVDETGGNLMAACAVALGAPDDTVARRFGFAAGMAAYLQAAAPLRAAGRTPLVDDNDAAIRAMATRGLDALDAARRNRASLPAAARPALLPGWHADPILRLARAEPGRVRAGTLGLSESAQRWRRLWVGMTGRV